MNSAACDGVWLGGGSARSELLQVDGPDHAPDWGRFFEAADEVALCWRSLKVDIPAIDVGVKLVNSPGPHHPHEHPERDAGRI